MRVVAYNIKEFEKEYLAKANAKVHDMTFISNPLTLCTIRYAKGKDAVIVSNQDIVDRSILDQLHKLGVQHIVTRSSSLQHIDLCHAKTLNIRIANILDTDHTPSSIAEQTIMNLSIDKILQDNCQSNQIFSVENNHKVIKKA